MSSNQTRSFALIIIGISGMVLLVSGFTAGDSIDVDVNGGGDFSTIQAGVNASQDGDTVVVHEGTYVEYVNMTQSITLKAAVGEKVVLRNDGYLPIISILTSNVRIQNLMFENSSTGMVIQFSGNTVIENCSFRNCVYGIMIASSSNNSIHNNTFLSNSWAGIIFSDHSFEGFILGECTKNQVLNNRFSRNDRGIAYYTRGTENIVHNNVFENNSKSGIFSIDNSPMPLDARFNWWGSSWGPYSYQFNPFGDGDTVFGNVNIDPWVGMEQRSDHMNLSEAFVFGEAEGEGNGTQERPFSRIMRAVYHIRSGGTIHVWEGTYFEHLIITTSLKIIGNGSSETIIESGVFGDCVSIRADGVEMREIGIQVSTNRSLFVDLIGTYPGHQSSLRIESSGNTIEDCTLSGGMHVVKLNHASWNTIRSNTLQQNSGPNYGYGIYLENGSDDNIISENVCKYFHRSGIYVTSSENNSILENTCMNNTIGIQIVRSNHTYLEWNSCSKNEEQGIRLDHSSFVIIANNSCNENGRTGIYLSSGAEAQGQCTDIEFTSNNLAGNEISAIDLGNSIRCILQKNILHSSGITMGLTPPRADEEHRIDETNMVNGKPVRYLHGKKGIYLREETGQIILLNCSDIVVENQYLTHCTIGVSLYFCKSITIRNSTCSDNIFGILVYFSDTSLLINNTLTDNSRDFLSAGIASIFSHNATVANCTISGNDFTGMGFVLSTKNSIVKNTITENGHGIFFLLDKTFLENVGQLPEIDFPSYGMNRVHENRIHGNTQYGVTVDEYNSFIFPIHSNQSNSVDARYNWWGDDSGPDHDSNRKGKGDAVSDQVEIGPWLDSEGNHRYPPTEDEKILDFLHPLDLLALIFVLVILTIILIGVVRSPNERFK